MRGAYLIAQTTDFFRQFREQLKTLPYEADVSSHSIRLNAFSASYFLLFDRDESDLFFEKYELPEEVSSSGYKYGFAVECRDERFFCEVVKSVAHHVDLIVCDGDGRIFTPEQLDPNTLTL